jgi:MFS family permease
MKFSLKVKNNIAILIGNVLDHYDVYIYTLLAPYIAKLFFVSDSHIISLVKAYTIAHVGLISRPLGAIIFGKIASTIGPLKALKYALVGVSISTLLIGFLPTYSQIGYFAPILLSVLRAMQSIFASGEGAIAGLYLVSNNPKKRSFFSSVYALATLLGMLIASKMCEIITTDLDPLVYWRVAFIFGFATSIAGMYIRSAQYQSRQIVQPKKHNFLTTLKNHKEKILKICILSGFSYISYPVCFVIMTSFLPFIKDISSAEMMRINSNLLIFDGLVIIASGYFLRFVNLKIFMIVCATILLFCEILLLWMATFASIEHITLIRMLLIAVGVPFVSAFRIWLANVMDVFGNEKYLISSTGVVTGVEMIGKSITILSIYTFHLYGNFICSMLYILVVFIGAIYSIYSYPYKPESNEPEHGILEKRS